MSLKDKKKKGELKPADTKGVDVKGGQALIDDCDELLKSIEDVKTEVEGFFCEACLCQNPGCPRRRYWDVPIDQIPTRVLAFHQSRS